MKKQDIEKRPYLLELIVALGQLGNAIAGGFADQTVSGRIGWHANYGNHVLYWLLPEIIVDWAFSPVDGQGHCISAIEIQAGVSDHTTAGLVGVTGLVIVFAVPIGIILRTRAAFIWCRDKLRSNFN